MTKRPKIYKQVETIIRKLEPDLEPHFVARLNITPYQVRMTSYLKDENGNKYLKNGKPAVTTKTYKTSPTEYDGWLIDYTEWEREYDKAAHGL